jgi:hypothetical protein
MNDIASIRKMRPLSLEMAFGFWAEEGFGAAAAPSAGKVADFLRGGKS